MDYGLSQDSFIEISGSAYLFKSGTLGDISTSTSASFPQTIAVTCSANTNNILTRLSNLGSYASIVISSGSIGNTSTTLVFRYVLSGSSNNNFLFTSPSQGNVQYVDIPILNNDDGFAVAYKTVNALNNTSSPLYTASLEEELGGIGTSTISGVEGSGSFIVGNFPQFSNLFHVTSSLGKNMAIGSSFQIRKGGGIGDSSVSNGFIVGEYPPIGKFILKNLKSGSVSSPDFSGTKPELGGMEIGDNFKIGGTEPLFSFNVIQSGSGLYQKQQTPGTISTISSSIGLTLDPDDKTSGLITGSGTAKLYMSSSGRVGFNTTVPQTDFEIATDKFQIRSKRESRGIFVNEEGNLESFNKTTEGATTGSEFILSYARGGSSELTSRIISVILNEGSFPGFEGYPESVEAQNKTDELISRFDSLSSFIANSDPSLIAEATHFGEKLGILGTAASAGDILGSLRWVADSGSFDQKYFDGRGGGEMLKIQGKVVESTSLGIKGDMIFLTTTNVANPPTEVMRIASDGNVHVTGSVNATGLKIGGVTVLAAIDEDNMSSNSATTVPTQQSVKAYVDANAGGSVSGNTFATDLKVGRDADNLIDFTTDNQVTFRVSAGNGVVMKASGEIEATKFDGALEGNADTATALATARNIGGVSFDGTGDINLPGVNTAGDQNTSGTATNATHVTVTDNENTNEENLIPFIEDASATGNVGLESDGDFAYNPSTGTVSATIFKGNIDAVDGDFDGTLEADALTIGGTNILTGGIVTTLGTMAGAIDFNNQNMTNVDIDSGTIDGCNITIGEGKTLELRNAGAVNLSTTLAQSIVSSADGAAIDNCIIGGTTAVAGTFTNLTATGNSVLGNASTDTHTITGNITASGAISSSGVITSDDGSGNGYTVRPNLYFFATNSSATVEGSSQEGALPATDTTTVALTQEQNSHSNVFSLSSNRLTIARAGLYKMSFNVTTELNNGSGRAESYCGLVQETSGGTVSLVDGTEGRGYHRFVAGGSAAASGQSYSANVIVNVAANSIYDIRFGLHNIDVAGQKLRTIDEGTSFLVEAIT